MLEPQIIEEIRSSLRKSAVELGKMKLYSAAKWSSEALVGMCEPLEVSIVPTRVTTASPGYDSPLKSRINTGGIQNNNFNLLDDMTTPTNNGDEFGFTSSEHDIYLLVSSLLDMQEYDRCVFFLKDATNPCLVFLKMYSLYLSWEKKTNESMDTLLLTGKKPKNKSMDQNEEEFDSLANNGVNSTAFVSGLQPEYKNFNKGAKTATLGEGHEFSITTMLKDLNDYLDELEGKIPENNKGLGMSLLYYLKGILQKADDNKKQAVSSFLQSLSYYSYNWNCWEKLGNCISRSDEVVQLIHYLTENFKFNPRCHSETQQSTESNVMFRFFKLSLLHEFTGSLLDEFIDDLNFLPAVFPNFSFLKAQSALIHYNCMDYTAASNLFEEIIKSDPYRLNDLDIYSNILYVMELQPKLSYLTQFVNQVDRKRPETCCIIANYYSMRQEHEKSIMYFRKALTLDRNCTNAWTLMGHEFVELKNSHAAIECYRRAVDINPKDFKAWYGLGQAYEVLDMYLYSLYYFQKVCALKPLDKRMWQALADCYLMVGNKDSSLKCYNRALQLSNNPAQDSVVLYKIAELHEKLNDIDNCKKMMIKTLKVEELTDGAISDETAKARLWLARYEANCKNYEKAYNYAVDASHGTSQEIEEARAIARECRKKMR